MQASGFATSHASPSNPKWHQQSGLWPSPGSRKHTPSKLQLALQSRSGSASHPCSLLFCACCRMYSSRDTTLRASAPGVLSIRYTTPASSAAGKADSCAAGPPGRS